MTTVLYVCPRTGLRVQGLIADEPAPGATSVSVDCPICNSVHVHVMDPLSARQPSPPSGQTTARPTTPSGRDAAHASGHTVAQMAMLGAAVVILLMIAGFYVW